MGRRVYRSGEAEYLINGETTRLKDIKNLFRGTGIGTDAYSLIEQGKVDRLLQANAKDRRAIFEEAAGISRFKAKKIEAERRLARVDANLIRLADIVEEVGSRYRKVKSQASKAVRYKEYTERLQQLRTYVGLKDWRNFSDKLAEHEEEANGYQQKSTSFQSQISEKESGLKELESNLDSISASLQEKQESATRHREKIAQVEAQISLNEGRLTDLAERHEQLNAQLIRSQNKTTGFKSQIAATEQELETAEIAFRDSSDALKKFEAELGSLDSQLESLRSETESKRTQYNELMVLVTEIGRLVSAGDTQFCTLNESTMKYRDEIEQKQQLVEVLTGQHRDILETQQRLKLEAESSDSELASARQKFDELKNRLDEKQNRLAQLAAQQAGLSQRAEVIEELEKRLEGINAGAKELLQLAREDRSGPMSELVGLVADLLNVNVQHAGIVDVFAWRGSAVCRRRRAATHQFGSRRKT